MIACLPMYDQPWLRGQTDILWDAIRGELGFGPDALTRSDDPWTVWRDPDLLLAQTCGLPFRAHLWDQVTLVGAPVHGLSDCAPGAYFSRVIRRRGDPRDLDALATGVMAYNDGLSQSGWAAPLALLGRMPAYLMQSGAHLASAKAVAEGAADFAAIDAVTWAMFCAHDPETAAGLDAFARTAPTPALPFITARGRDPAPLRTAIDKAIAGLTAAHRSALCLHGIVPVDAAQHLGMLVPPAPPSGE